MYIDRGPIKDPRSVSRELPGVIENIFPQLNPSLVSFLNKQTVSFEDIDAIPYDSIKETSISRAMLFEIAVALAELEIKGEHDNKWDKAINVAVARQRRYFDAQIPSEFVSSDRYVAEAVCRNLVSMIARVDAQSGASSINISPIIPGYRWISSGHGDFSIKDILIEVKCHNRNYGSLDYRQVLFYWLLSYCSSHEGRDFSEWRECVLLNPRRGTALSINFDRLIRLASGGMGKVEILQLFEFVVGDHILRLSRSN